MPVKFSVPPVEEIQPPSYAAQIGAIREIKREPEHIQQIDACYCPFAENLLYLAQTMNDEAILDLIKQAMS